VYTLIRALSLKQGLMQQLPALIGALCLAELFYKFHSFLLECGAFLATWFVLDALIQAGTQLTRPKGFADLRRADCGAESFGSAPD
jgi:hypothetical protein